MRSDTVPKDYTDRANAKFASLIATYTTIFRKILSDKDVEIVYEWGDHCNSYAYGFSGKFTVKRNRIPSIYGWISSVPGFCGCCVIHNISVYINSSTEIFDAMYNFLMDIAYADKYRCVMLTDKSHLFDDNIKKYSVIKKIMNIVHHFVNARTGADVSIGIIELDKRGIRADKMLKKYLPTTNSVLVDKLNQI